MVSKKEIRAILKQEGLELTDNNIEVTTWPRVNQINQKNYYTEFLKRDDQLLATRLQQEERLNATKKAAIDNDRARAFAGQEGEQYQDMEEEMTMDDVNGENHGSRTIVLHVGSQNLRLGLATDALPRTIPMVVARKDIHSESEIREPRPKRVKTNDTTSSEHWFGDDFACEYNAVSTEFRQSRRQNKRRVLPNSRELVTKWNATTNSEQISEHNDAMRIDWTELPPDPRQAPNYVVGEKALRIPEKSTPRYRLRWPVRGGCLNEGDYDSRSTLERDFFLIIEESIKHELGLNRMKDWNQYSCVFIIPDLYEKAFVASVLRHLFHDFNFQRVCFLQESVAASFGAGYSIACIVDVGAQKTSICCVEDGMCSEDARVNLKYGGYDLTETFIQMMLFDKFNYSDFNLLRRHDFLLAEELKQQFVLLNDEAIAVQLHEMHVRAYGQETRRYEFKIYDQGMLAAMGLFRPAIFNNGDKIAGRHSFIAPSTDLYDGKRNDPLSAAQLAVITWVGKNMPAAIMAPPAKPTLSSGTTAAQPAVKQRHLALPSHLGVETDGTPRSSLAGTPQPEETGTPVPTTEGGEGEEGDAAPVVQGAQPDIEAIDRTVPLMPLHQAILTSIEHASGTDERRKRDFLGSIMLVGGGSKTQYLGQYLEARLRAALPQYPKEILVARPPRELDPAVIAWKGGSVFGRLRMTNDSWIGPLEYDRLGSRIMSYKCIWHW